MLSDEKGYAFTPLTLLLFIPIVILAISYGNIVSEANMLANIATGGDISYTVSKDIINNMKLASQQAGRNVAYNVTRELIDNHSSGKPNVFFAKGQSKKEIKRRIANGINSYIADNLKYKLSNGTGRIIYVDSIEDNNLEIYQTEPFGFYVTIKPGVKVEVSQEGQKYTYITSNITSYVSIEKLEDPYIWVNLKEKYSNIFNRYPYYSDINNKYLFDLSYDTSDNHLHYLWDAYNGTNNPSNITPRPYYFPDERGLSFFERLENGRNDADNPKESRLSSFVLGNPLYEVQHGGEMTNDYYTSCVDWEYVTKTPGCRVMLYNKTNRAQRLTNPYMEDPLDERDFMLSESSLKVFGFDYKNYDITNHEVRVYV